MTNDEARRLGDDARRHYPSYVAAIEAVRNQIIERLTEARVEERDKILGEHAKLQLLMELDRSISKIIADGDISAAVENLPSQ